MQALPESVLFYVVGGVVVVVVVVVVVLGYGSTMSVPNQNYESFEA